jgi:glycosyltransferase involved in cell wall biosynthesis
MIPTYNPGRYLEKTIESVLAQAPGPGEMQIEVVDDCSMDSDVEEIVRRAGGGRVSVYRRSERGGLCANWNTCIERARGHWVHILHQDDLVLPGFYHRLRLGIESEPDIGAAFCRHLLIDEDGNWYHIPLLLNRFAGIIPDWLERISSSVLLQTPSIVVKREVYERIGGFNPELIYTLDWEMWKRIAAHYPVWYEPQPLACYRTHNSSETSRLVRTGADIEDVRKCIEMSRAYLPVSIADKASKKAGETFALYAVHNAEVLFRQTHFYSSLIQIRGALRCRFSWEVLKAVVVYFVWALGCLIKYTPLKVISMLRQVSLKYWEKVRNSGSLA